MDSLDSFKCLRPLKVGSKTYAYYSLPAAEKNGLKGISRLPFSLKVLLENLLAQRGRPLGQQGGHPGGRAMAQDQDFGARTGVPAGARADAGFHRRAGGRRSRRYARCDGTSRRRSEKNQPAGAGGSGHRPFGGGEFLRPQGFVQEKRRRGIQAEPGTLPLPQMGAELVRGFPRGAARHRHLPPGQSRISGAYRLDREGQDHLPRQVGGDRARLSGHAGGHGFAHHDGQRPIRAGLGRRRHRGRGRHARPALFDAAAGSDRSAIERQAQGRRHRDRSRPYGDADAAQARRRRQIRRIFRPGTGESDDRRPRHDRQHVAGIWRDLRLLSDRRRHHPLSARHRPPRRPDRARHCLCQGARPVPRQEYAGPGVHRRAQARTVLGRAIARRAQASARPHCAQRGRRAVLPNPWTKSSAKPARWTSAFRSKAATSRSATATW